MRKQILLIMMTLMLMLLLIACSPANTDQPPVGEPDPQPPLQQPESLELTINREGLEETFTAYAFSSESGLEYYLFPEFIVSTEGDIDILQPGSDTPYLPVQLMISNNGESLDLQQALELAKANYPDIEFVTDAELYQLDGNMSESIVSYGIEENEWVICGALAGEHGTVSFWGQGDMETAEGLRVLLLSQIGAIHQ